MQLEPDLIVEPGVRQQRDARLEETDVADDDGACAETVKRSVIDADPHSHGGEAERLDAGNEVREPAHALLEVVVDAGHDLGVHA